MLVHRLNDVLAAVVVALLAAAALAACSGGNSGAIPEVKSNQRAADAVAISGTVTFDLIPHKVGEAALDYTQIRRAPVRGAQVQLLSGDTGAVLDTAVTDDAGAYQLQAPADTEVRVRILARMLREGRPGWDFSVTDNTQGNALYALEGRVANSGDSDSIRDLHAPSGWTGKTYEEQRPAAPFAILDTVYQAAMEILQVDSAVTFPPLQLRWSTDNLAVSGESADGAVGTTHYSTASQSIYLLGVANNDTDEYDRSVIAHEFAHYLEDRLGRTDSIGGSHSAYALLDMRVALSEGWGNAFAGIVTGDPLYRDSIGTRQSGGFSFSVETNTFGNRGWYSENSVQKILYDLYDATSDGADQVSLGFGPIYRTLTSEAFRRFDGALSIFTFIALFNSADAGNGQALEPLLLQEQIASRDAYGEGESNHGELVGVLPVYHHLAAGETTEVCSNAESGEYNGLSVRRFVRVQVDTSGAYRLLAERRSGLTNADPELVFWRAGERLQTGFSTDSNREELALTLERGYYWFEVYDASNTDEDIATGGDVCFVLSFQFAP